MTTKLFWVKTIKWIYWNCNVPFCWDDSAKCARQRWLNLYDTHNQKSFKSKLNTIIIYSLLLGINSFSLVLEKKYNVCRQVVTVLLTIDTEYSNLLALEYHHLAQNTSLYYYYYYSITTSLYLTDLSVKIDSNWE